VVHPRSADRKHSDRRQIVITAGATPEASARIVIATPETVALDYAMLA
jgi:hypothetical protein